MMTIQDIEPKDENELLPPDSSIHAYLFLVKKAHTELVGHDSAHERFSKILTRRHAHEYVNEVMRVIRDERHKRRRKRARR